MRTNLDPICDLATCQHQACKEADACKGIEWRERHAEAYLRAQAEDLIANAAEWGYVLTIEQQPLQPLAMGNYESVVTVRRARHA